jgi:hypothetical protein
MVRTSGPDGDASTRRVITFSGSGSVGIPAAGSATSDWVEMNFTSSNDYLLTVYYAPGSCTLSGWTGEEGAVYSYILDAGLSMAAQETWSSSGYTGHNIIYCADSISICYLAGGTVTSQVYDTNVDDPEYGSLKWVISKNNYGDFADTGPGADVTIKVRSGDDPDALKADVDWSSVLEVDTRSAVSGTADIGAIGSGRYAQFRLEFASKAAPGSSIYTKSPVVKSVSIDWPGLTRMVDVSGYFTKRPDYGMFGVKIDGKSLNKGVEAFIEVSQKFAGQTAKRSLTIEVEPRNTGR